MNKVSPRQLYFFLLFICPVGKLLLFPTELIKRAGNDLLFPAFLGFLLESVVLYLVLLLSTDGDLYDRLTRSLGKVAGGMVSCLLALFFLFVAILPIAEQKLFVQSTFYDTLPSELSFFPFFIFCAFLSAKPTHAVGRTWDVLFPLSVLGLSGIFILSVPSADFSALLPIGSGGFIGTTSALTASMPWLFDVAVVFAYAGYVPRNKEVALKGTAFFLLGSLLVLFFLATFYGIFSDFAIRQTYALGKISKYFSAVAVLGRIDYIFIILVGIVMVFYLAYPVQIATELFFRLGAKKIPCPVWACFTSAILFSVDFALDFYFHSYLQTLTDTLWWLFPLFGLGMPLLLSIIGRFYERKMA